MWRSNLISCLYTVRTSALSQSYHSHPFFGSSQCPCRALLKTSQFWVCLWSDQLILCYPVWERLYVVHSVLLAENDCTWYIPYYLLCDLPIGVYIPMHMICPKKDVVRVFENLIGFSPSSARQCIKTDVFQFIIFTLFTSTAIYYPVSQACDLINVIIHQLYHDAARDSS